MMRKDGIDCLRFGVLRNEVASHDVTRGFGVLRNLVQGAQLVQQHPVVLRVPATDIVHNVHLGQYGLSFLVRVEFPGTQTWLCIFVIGFYR